MCREDVVALSARGDAVAEGRHHVESVLRRWFAEPGRLVDDAALVTSELLTNALRAGAPVLELRVEAHARMVRVGVHDDMPGRPDPRPSVAATEIAGRGLTVVERLAQRWGVDEQGAGKLVWVQLPVPPAATTRFNCELDGGR